MGHTLDTDQKALEINLNQQIYGTFAEIGAGQEVARYFFKVGAAAGTIAKTMSAYDKTYSDEIYGVEDSGRYVCENRLYKMLNHEYNLLVDRLKGIRENTCFFAFADTISTLNFHRTIKGNGWIGIRFQARPNTPPNDLVLHVRLLDNATNQQQAAVGKLGVNLVYACFNYAKEPEKLLCSLMEQLRGRIKIDMVRFSGPDFTMDQRLVAYWLVRNRLSDVSLLTSEGANLHASELLYKKNMMVVRGNFRPVTLTTQDLIRKSFTQFCLTNELEKDKTAFLFTEIMLKNRDVTKEQAEIDFLERAIMLNQLGYNIMVSDCSEHEMIGKYFNDYKLKKIAITLGAKKLERIIQQKVEQGDQKAMLSLFGELFRRPIELYIYPALLRGYNEMVTSKNLSVPEEVKFLYQHLLQNNFLVDVDNPDPALLLIYSKAVLESILSGRKTWEKEVPPIIREMILKNNYLLPKSVSSGSMSPNSNDD